MKETRVPPAQEPEPGWRVQAAAVRELLLAHPRLAPLRSAGEEYWVDADDQAISIRARTGGRIAAGEAFTHGIRDSRWWQPMERRRAQEIADRLAEALFRSWDVWDDHGSGIV